MESVEAPGVDPFRWARKGASLSHRGGETGEREWRREQDEQMSTMSYGAA